MASQARRSIIGALSTVALRSPIKRLKDLEKENQQLKRMITDLNLAASPDGAIPSGTAASN